ncbi:hypothetical protein Naga_101160g3 [Nannochloropsis gaditana]|uniref:Uncharacterized protein n=1 Tax=Nannochloropsis gaditana TaxID=72520 RepID=W7T811_9STRA|nr:hypothetical protein Naga_101160g3 [Nannochloropsis gaditana]
MPVCRGAASVHRSPRSRPYRASLRLQVSFDAPPRSSSTVHCAPFPSLLPFLFPIRSQPSPGAAATMSPDLRVVSEGGGGGKGEEGGEGEEEEAEDGRGAREEEVRAARWWEDRAALSSLLRDIRQGRRPVDGPLLDLLLVMGRRVFDASYRPSAGVLSACRPRFKEGTKNDEASV